MEPGKFKLDLGIATLRNQSVAWILGSWRHLQALAATGLVMKGYQIAGTDQVNSLFEKRRLYSFLVAASQHAYC